MKSDPWATLNEQFKLHQKIGMLLYPEYIIFNDEIGPFIFISQADKSSLSHLCFFFLSFLCSHVHAAYASFIWEIEEGEGEDNGIKDLGAMQPLFHGIMASAIA